MTFNHVRNQVEEKTRYKLLARLIQAQAKSGRVLSGVFQGEVMF